MKQITQNVLEGQSPTFRSRNKRIPSVTRVLRLEEASDITRDSFAFIHQCE